MLVRAVILVCVVVLPLCGQDLFEAARTGDTARLQILVSKGADVNAINEAHRTALHEAAQNGQVEAIRLLIKAGADPGILDDKSRSPMAFAMDYPDPGIRGAMVALLQITRPSIPQDTDPWTLHFAAAHNNLDVGKMLIGLGTDVNAVGSSGDRPLNVACLKGYADFVQLLIAHGVNVNARSKDGTTALHDAALGGNPEVAALLLKAGAEVDAKETASGATPLYYAVSMSRTECAKFLIAHGASTTVSTKTGKTILQTAIDNHLTEIVELIHVK